MKMSNDLLCDGDERSVCVQPTECHGPCLRKRKDTVFGSLCVCVRACACSVYVCVCICVYVSCCLLRHPWVLTCKKCKCAVLGWLCVCICWWLISVSKWYGYSHRIVDEIWCVLEFVIFWLSWAKSFTIIVPQMEVKNHQDQISVWNYQAYFLKLLDWF